VPQSRLRWRLHARIRHALMSVVQHKVVAVETRRVGCLTIPRRFDAEVGRVHDVERSFVPVGASPFGARPVRPVAKELDLIRVPVIAWRLFLPPAADQLLQG